MKFNIGDKVRDIATKVEGTVEQLPSEIGLYGVRIRKEKKSRSYYFPEHELELIQKNQTLTIGIKYDEGKPDFTMVNLELIKAVTRAMEFGAKKYGKDNYKFFTKKDIPRFKAALLRHIYDYLEDGIDSDSGLASFDHVCSCINILAFLTNKKESL